MTIPSFVTQVSGLNEFFQVVTTQNANVPYTATAAGQLIYCVATAVTEGGIGAPNAAVNVDWPAMIAAGWFPIEPFDAQPLTWAGGDARYSFFSFFGFTTGAGSFVLPVPFTAAPGAATQSIAAVMGVVMQDTAGPTQQGGAFPGQETASVEPTGTGGSLISINVDYLDHAQYTLPAMTPPGAVMSSDGFVLTVSGAASGAPDIIMRATWMFPPLFITPVSGLMSAGQPLNYPGGWMLPMVIDPGAALAVEVITITSSVTLPCIPCVQSVGKIVF